MKTPAESAETDRDLVRAVLERGDERAFRSLYRHHTPRPHAIRPAELSMALRTP